MGGLVQVILTDTEERIAEFIDTVRREKPRMAQISRIDRETIDLVLFDGFKIASSTVDEDEIAVIPADIAACDECIKEYNDPSDPRYRYPYISCSNCGPRYSIMEKLPYDRDNTTMSDFVICDTCKAEYSDIGDRRYHSQTISCHDCGPQAIMRVNGSEQKDIEIIIRTASDLVNNGGIVALKGVGGYYFVCSPFDEAAVKKLRAVKIREEKPFAVMFSDVEGIRDYCRVSSREEELLVSPKRPIVLLEKLEHTGAARPLAANVCNSSRFIGAFLPSSGLQYSLLKECGPLIMTSANLSDMPIIKDDQVMLGLADTVQDISAVLYNSRRIKTSLDDSVTCVIDGGPALIRRSKGWVPAPVYIQGTGRLTRNDMIFAAGGDLKSTFAFSKGSFCTLSQYLSDLDSIEAEKLYMENLHRMEEFYNMRPGHAVCDMHPLYRSSAIARTIAKERGIPLIEVQHHHAHIASVIAEHGLVKPVIGIACDGTGFGADGHIWGGEVMICQGSSFTRFSHLREIDMIGGDSSMKEGWKSAICHMRASHSSLHDHAERGVMPEQVNRDEDAPFDIDLSEIMTYAEMNNTLAEHEADIETICAAVESRVNTISTSSMGRMFDAVSALLGLHHESRYEGECAIMLENAADRALNAPGVSRADDLALEFHMNVAEALFEQCRKARDISGISTVAISGGVFQNRILTGELLRKLREDGFAPYIARTVPANDGGIALGQIYIAARRLLGE